MTGASFSRNTQLPAEGRGRHSSRGPVVSRLLPLPSLSYFCLSVRLTQDPRRTIASCVLVEGGELPQVSVRLTKPVPRDRIFDVMALIHTLKLQAPVTAGTVVVPDVLGLGSDLIATRTVRAL